MMEVIGVIRLWTVFLKVEPVEFGDRLNFS